MCQGLVALWALRSWVKGLFCEGFVVPHESTDERPSKTKDRVSWICPCTTRETQLHPKAHPGMRPMHARGHLAECSDHERALLQALPPCRCRSWQGRGNCPARARDFGQIPSPAQTGALGRLLGADGGLLLNTTGRSSLPDAHVRHPKLPSGPKHQTKEQLLRLSHLRAFRDRRAQMSRRHRPTRLTAFTALKSELPLAKRGRSAVSSYLNALSISPPLQPRKAKAAKALRGPEP